MGINIKIFTRAGLVKTPCASSDSPKGKIRFYFFSDQTPETVAKVQTIFQVETKEKKICGSINYMFQEVQANPYLFREGNTLKLITEEEALRFRTKNAYDSLGDFYYLSGEYHQAAKCGFIVLMLKNNILDRKMIIVSFFRELLSTFSRNHFVNQACFDCNCNLFPL